MKKYTKAILLIVVAILVVGAFISISKPSTIEDTITLGFIGPLTGDGALWGDIEKNVIEIAVDEINSAGGVNGRKLEVIYEDGKCTGKGAVAAVQKLIGVDKVKILLVSCSQEILPISPITEANEVIVFGSYAADSAITEAGDFVFRNSWTNSDYSQTVAQTIVKDHNNLGILTEESDFSADLRDRLIVDYKNLGGSTRVSENFLQGAKDTSTQIAKIIEKNPSAIFVNPIGPATLTPILNELKKQQYLGQVYANFAAGSASILELESAKGITYFADPQIENESEKQRFFSEYKDRYGTLPDLEFPAATRYDSVHILVDAMRAVGTDTEDIRDYLYSLPMYDGVLGTYHFDKNGDAVGIQASVKTIE